MPSSITTISTAALVALIGFAAFTYFWPKLTLFEPDYRVERFRSLSQAFPSTPITASPHPVAYDVNAQPMPEHYNYGATEKRLDEFLDRSETTAFLVVHKGNIVHENYRQGNAAADLVTSFSVAKSFVSTLVGIAYHDGLIDSLEDPISKYVPDLAKSGFNNVAISDVLTMSSGIDFSEVYDDKSTDAYTIYNKLFAYFRSIKSVMSDYGSQADAGQQFHYASINTQALGLLIESVSGMPVSKYLEQKLWHPLGAQSDANWITDSYGNVLSFWGLNATVRDFARLGVLYAQDGQFQGKQIVPSQWVAQATSAPQQRLARGQIEDFWGYGYQWWLPEGSKTDFAAIGIWGQFIYVHPVTETVIVKMSADPAFKAHEPEAIAAFRSIVDGLGNDHSD